MSREPFCRPPGDPLVAPDQRQPTDEGSLRGMSAAEARRAASRCLATIACTWCEVCELMCPDQCITRDPDIGLIRISLEHCKGCGLCAHFCPKGAIRMEFEPAG